MSDRGGRRRILFVLRHAGYVRNFESTLRLLASRGHQIHLALERDKRRKGEREATAALAEWLCRDCPGITHGLAPGREPDGWFHLAREVRRSANYLRYLEPRYQDASKLRRRAEGRAHRYVLRLAQLSPSRTTVGLRAVNGLLRLAEESIPDSPRIEAFIREQRPDLVLVTPLVEFGSTQADYVRAAKAVGVRSGLTVYSWDNLTNKGLIHDLPDFVTVWNEAQKQEAVELHGVPAASVVVTGAPIYDQWFGGAPRTTREAFCGLVGLPAERPFILYLCSSPFIAPEEVPFVREWIGQIRGWGEPPLREAGILIRPHPQNAAQWRDANLAGLADVAVWPRGGADPIDARSKAEFFDSIYHCAAVVGVNTSALIESAIVGRPVHTLLAPEFAETQEGTLHFHHLLEVNGGLLHVARTFEEHLCQLARALDPSHRQSEKSRRFIEAFVRPHGLDVPATPMLAATLEAAAAASPPRPRPRPLSAQLVRPLLAPLARRFEGGQTGPARLGEALRRGVRSSLQSGRAKRVARRYILRGLSYAVRELGGEAPTRPSAGRVDVGAPATVGSATMGRNGKPAPASDGLPDEARQVGRAAAKLAREAAGGPVIAGPWVSEVGFELLYWIPMLNWIRAREPDLADRLTVVSRGGTSHWYQHVSERYVEVFDHVGLDEFVAGMEEAVRLRRGKQKQLKPSPFETQLVERIGRAIGDGEPRLLHPSLMYRALRPFTDQDAVARMREISEYRRFEPPPVGPLGGLLPEDYVAVRFYFNYSFPETEQNRRLVASVLRALTDKTTVVLLNTGIRLDDHWDAEVTDSQRLVKLDHLMRPPNNLHLQTIALSRARAFVGTYGGLSYLPPFFGVPSVCFYSDPSRFNHHHLELARRIFKEPGWGDFVALDTKHADVLGLLYGREPATRALGAE